VDEMTVEAKVRKIGTSLGVIIPKEKLEELAVKEGDIIIIRRIEKPVEEIRGILKGVDLKFERESEDRDRTIDAKIKSIRKRAY